jgi:hypothetical protein
MEGRFEAVGNKLDSGGNLQAFKETFTAIKDSDHSITFYADDKKYGSWFVSSQTYKLVTYNDHGDPDQDPVAVIYSCEEIKSSGTVMLTESWVPQPDPDGRVWQLNQTRLLTSTQLEVSTTVREKGSPLPPVVVSTYIAKRSANTNGDGAKP